VLIVSRGDGVDWKEAIITMVEHCHCRLAHHSFCLLVKISTNHVNGVVVDSAVPERHGAARA
jgi:hypothetical protein